MSLITGSTAARHWIPTWRDPRDLDMFSPVALMGADTMWTPEIGEWLATRDYDGDSCNFATLDELVTIKASHLYWDLKNGSWNKHMTDYLRLLKAGAVVDWELHDTLRRGWVRLHGRKPVDLTQGSKDFFTDAVTRRYVHDSLHRSVAYYDEPLFKSVLKDGATVQMDMDKVWAMPFEDQIRMFREEIYVTALERLIIPAEYRYSSGRAYQWALRRTVTSLVKGESAKFLVKHLDIFRLPDIDYVKLHHSRADRLELLEVS